jgi:hypothetical protein
MSSNIYVKNMIKTAKEHLDRQGLPLKMKVTATLPARYRPELDVSEEPNDQGANQFQEVIAILRWMVELGQINITTPVALLSSILALPRTTAESVNVAGNVHAPKQSYHAKQSHASW